MIWMKLRKSPAKGGVLLTAWTTENRLPLPLFTLQGQYAPVVFYSFMFLSFSCQTEERKHERSTCLHLEASPVRRVFWNIPHFTLCTSLNKVWINYCVHHWILIQQNQSWMRLCYQTHMDVFRCFRFNIWSQIYLQRDFLKNKEYTILLLCTLIAWWNVPVQYRSQHLLCFGWKYKGWIWVSCSKRYLDLSDKVDGRG